jgi:hypothetical protein
MIRFTLTLALLGACAPTPKPVVTGGGASADGRTAWFAVTRGEALTIYRCEPRGCFVVPRGDEPPRRMPTAVEATDPRGATAEEVEPGDETDDDDDGPEEERLDMMDGVL